MFTDRGDVPFNFHIMPAYVRIAVSAALITDRINGSFGLSNKKEKENFIAFDTDIVIYHAADTRSFPLTG